MIPVRSIVNEFKEFALRGSVIDMAIGVVIGTAFGKIVSSLVNDILMPPLGLLIGHIDFSNLYVNLSGSAAATLEEAKKTGVPTLNYGMFINSVLDFLLVSWVMFAVVKQMNRIRGGKQKPAAGPAFEVCPHCLSEIPAGAARCGHCTSFLNFKIGEGKKEGPQAKRVK